MAKMFVITNNIRKLRFFANEMTQQELAERVGDGVKDNYEKISGKAKSFIDGVRKKGERDE